MNLFSLHTTCPLTYMGKDMCLTFDGQREVPIFEGCGVERDPAQVVGVVHPLITCRKHVHHPLHGAVLIFPIHVPVHHPLSVPHPVSGPHHAAADTLQHYGGAGARRHVVASHDHAAAAAVRLT